MSKIQKWVYPKIAISNGCAIQEAGVCEQIEPEALYDQLREQLMNEKSRVECEAGRYQKLQEEYRRKIEKIDQMSDRLKSVFARLDSELVDILSGLVSKIVRVLIKKEIAKDHSLFASLFQGLADQLLHDEKIIKIRISQEDLSACSVAGSSIVSLCQVDENLASGDIMVETNFGSINGLLEARLKSLLSNEECHKDG